MPSTPAKRTVNSSSTKTTSKSTSPAHSPVTSSLSSDKKAKFRLHEIVFQYQGQTSWMYFQPNKDPKSEGEKHFKRVCRDSGWTKGSKLVTIRPIVKAIDPPLTKAQKNALRQGTRTQKSSNPRRTRGTGSVQHEPKAVPGTGPSTSLSRLLESSPPRSKVSKIKLPKNKRNSRKGSS